MDACGVALDELIEDLEFEATGAVVVEVAPAVVELLSFEELDDEIDDCEPELAAWLLKAA